MTKKVIDVSPQGGNTLAAMQQHHFVMATGALSKGYLYGTLFHTTKLLQSLNETIKMMGSTRR